MIGAMLARFFKFAALGTTLHREVLAGVTTFVTMAYILAVNPAILSEAIFLNQPGDLFGELVIATALAAAIATLIMGFVAKYPFALAPGMGLNAYFAYTAVGQLGLDWRVALAAVFVEGILFIFLTFANLRSQIVSAIPDCIKQATAAGIGLFIAYIALSNPVEKGGAGIIVAHPATLTSLGDTSHPQTLIAIAGIFVTAVLVARRIPGGLLLGVLATAVLGWISGIAQPPTGLIQIPDLPVDLVGQAFVGLGQLLQVDVGEFLTVLFVFLFVDLFGTAGTFMGLGIQAGYINDEGEFPGANRAFLADSVGTTVGAILGTSPTTTYIESAAGIAEGGRSGFTAVVAAILFVLAILFIPLLSAIPAFATAPALVIVGVLMARNVRNIRWDDETEAIPAFLTLLVMPLSYSIADGLAVGLIAYPLLKTARGKGREVKAIAWILAALFILKFAIAPST